MTALASLPEYIAGLAHLGRRPAVIEQRLYRATFVSYAELLGRAFALEREFDRRGIRPGDRVLIWGSSGAAWAITFYACVLAGAVVVPLDAAFTAGFVERVREQTEAVLLCGDQPQTHAVGASFLAFDAIAALAPAPPPSTARVAPAPEALLEIVYTSGATAEPKGVMITHGNLLANLRPIAAEIDKYKSRARPLLPLRFLHLIPLSHLFGQVMGLMIPPLLASAVVYPETQAPTQWAALIHRHRVSAMVAVPQQLQLFSQWAEAELGRASPALVAEARGHGPLWRWARHWRLHRRLGWKMWAFLSGGAALAPEIEDFWGALGFAVLQGYGLTETAPAIAITHPFKMRRGAVGRMLAGVETRLGPDGEILVRGPNVSPGYFRNPAATGEAFADGWLHTGDLGRVDAEGNLHFLGRKKEVIVTADGLNVYPEDVERALDRQPPVAESAAVELRRGASSAVHVAAVLRPGYPPTALEQAVAAANASLEAHQRIRGASLWPGPHLPRTASTRKLQRVAVAAWVNGDGAPPSAISRDNSDWRQFAAERWGLTPERLRPEARLDADLGLSSLDRVELFTWIESHASVGVQPSLSEFTFASAHTVGDLNALLGAPAPTGRDAADYAPPAAPAPAPAWLRHEPDWPRTAALRGFRRLALPALVFPALRTVVSSLQITGRERLAPLRRPVLFIANHQSLLDVPVIARALPGEWRPWLAAAMGSDAVAEGFNPAAPLARRFRAWRRMLLLRAFFNTFLLTDQASIGGALRHAGALVDAGYCPLIFPEGRRTTDGKLQPFRPGIGVFAAELRIPVVPIRIAGLSEILPPGARRPRRGPVRVEIGPALQFRSESSQKITESLEQWFRLSR